MWPREEILYVSLLILTIKTPWRKKSSTLKKKKYYEVFSERKSIYDPFTVGLTSSVPSNVPTTSGSWARPAPLGIPVRYETDSVRAVLKSFWKNCFVWSQIHMLGDYLLPSSRTISFLFSSSSVVTKKRMTIYWGYV